MADITVEQAPTIRGTDEDNKIYLIGSLLLDYSKLDPDRIKKTIIILNDKLIKFLSDIYLGPLFEEGEPKEPIQSYLKFLDPSDPYYGITSAVMFYFLLSKIYPEANDLMRLSFGVETGTRPCTEIKEYFSEEYDKILNKFIKHQEKYGEVEGEYRQYKYDGSHTSTFGISRNKELGCLTNNLWRIPREFSSLLASAIKANNTEKYQIDDEEFENWVKEHALILSKLKYSRDEMKKHPEVKAGAVAVKIAGRKG